jgi:hypothetical protein
VVAAELAGAGAQAASADTGWDDVRDRLRSLASLLGEPESDDRPWWRRVRDAVGAGVTALRRVGVAKLLEESLKAGTGAMIGAAGVSVVGGPTVGLVARRL